MHQINLNLGKYCVNCRNNISFNKKNYLDCKHITTKGYFYDLVIFEPQVQDLLIGSVKIRIIEVVFKTLFFLLMKLEV